MFPTLDYAFSRECDHGESTNGSHAPKTVYQTQAIGNDVVLSRELTTTMRGDQLIDSSVLNEPVTDHAIPRHAGVISVF